MNHFRLLSLAVLTLINLRTFSAPDRSALTTENNHSVFSQENADLYWEALIQMAHNNKQVALNIIETLKSGNPTTEISSWKDQQPENIDAFFDQLFINYIMHSPQWITQMGLFDAIGVNEHNAHLDDVSPEAVFKRFQVKKDSFNVLNNYRLDELTQDQKVSYKVFSWMLGHAADGERFVYHRYEINQMEGILGDLSMIMTQFHKIENDQDVENFIARLEKIPAQIQQAIRLIEHQKNNGVLPPQFTVKKVASNIEKANPSNPHENVFYSYLAQSLERASIANKDEFLNRAANILDVKVKPAYAEIKNYFENLFDVATSNNGVWALPHGDEYYLHMLRYHTSTNLTPEKIYELGLAEVESIQNEMRKIFAQEGIIDEQKSVGVLLEELSKDPQFYYPNTDEGRAQCLVDYGLILERIRKELGHLFDLKPKTGVKIEKVPMHEEEGAPGAYYFQPSIDGSRPGIFFANLRNMAEVPTFGMETLTVHEAEPGHHFQLALQNEIDIPILRKINNDFTAFYEGWALYTEKLAYEEGFYSSSFSKLGHLQDELLRAARLVTDTGIHHKRWTREQAIEYMVQVTGMHYDSVATEVERYFVLPGQACSYKIGQLKILELRKRAKDTLRNKFDIREFHNVVLQHGAVPLMVLEELVDQYIQDVLAR
jgi:uncharacterized protein (DUF885 family)